MTASELREAAQEAIWECGGLKVNGSYGRLSLDRIDSALSALEGKDG